MPEKTEGLSRNDVSGGHTGEHTGGLQSRHRVLGQHFRDKNVGGPRDPTAIAAMEQFENIGVRELLEQDSRPTFILDLEGLDRTLKGLPLTPIFNNRSLRSSKALQDVITGRVAAEVLGRFITYREYQGWVIDLGDFGQDTFFYGGLMWTRSTIRSRWRVVSGNPCYENPGLSPEEQLVKSLGDTGLGTRRNTSKGRRSSKGSSGQQISRSPSPDQRSLLAPSPVGCSDWTAPKIEGQLSAHVQFTRNIDWAATPLGPMESWSAEFRQIANLLMASPHPGALFWGADLTMMYNEAYRDGVAGRKHPGLMGTGFKGPFSEMWDTVGGIMAECARTGKAIAMVDQMLPIERHGFLEETYFSWCFVPLYESYRTPRGFWNAPFETTKQVTNARRTQLLRIIGEEASLSKTIKEFWTNVMHGLESNEYDVPFALLYSVVEDGSDTDSSSTSSSGSGLAAKSCVYEGSLGIPEGHAAAPRRLDLNRANEGFIPSFREAMSTREPTMLVSKDGTLPQSLLEGIEWRGYGEPCREAIIFPVRPTNGQYVVGFLLLGINPRRPYDDDYRSFVHMLDRQLATSLASVILFEDEIRAGRSAAEAAALERAHLRDQLDLQTMRLQRMTESSPVGMYYIDSDGQLLEANDRWYAMTGHPKGGQEKYNLSFMNYFGESTRPLMEQGWHQLVVEGRSWSGELLLKKPQIAENGETRDYWTLAAAHPEFDSSGKVISVMGSLTDISSQKHLSEEALKRARLSEELAKRTQEVAKSERNFKRFSDLAPVGLIVMDAEGHITYANVQWYELSGHPKESNNAGPMSWNTVVHPDYLAVAEEKWKGLYTGQAAFTMELRMKKTWITGTGSVGETWLLTSVSPELADGKVVGVMACLTDISHIKWAEGLQNRRLEEAEATRRQQNNFIDIVSHEMRNPIGAILGYADDISAALLHYQSSGEKSALLLARLVADCAESAETIALCAQHQKSIVDDILTISKLDSDLLLLTPTVAQPIVVAQRAVKMFDAEIQKKDITMSFTILDSYKDLDVDWVMHDPSRLLQILINLITNAIKFTQSEAKRAISVSVSAFDHAPMGQLHDFQYIPPRNPDAVQAFGLGDEWGSGELLFLKFEIGDSGCGLTADEKKILFQRFSQASPRTHAQYGGSGLGLFICRQLTEFHGGQIGVASEAGVGSIFAFYIRGKRASRPRSRPTSLSPVLAQKWRESNTVKSFTQPDGAPTLTTDSRHILSPDIVPVDTKDLHILLVEDNLVNQKVLKKQLLKLGCAVEVACHGEEALEYLARTNVAKGKENSGDKLSLVLMDLEMPVMDGLTCVRRIREMEKEGAFVCHIPVIAVTANVRTEQMIAARESGMDDVVTKPFRIPHLVAKVQEVLGGYTP